MNSLDLISNSYTYFKSLDYIVYNTFPLLIKDSTLLFTNSSLAPFKKHLLNGENIQKTFLIQKCFRAHFQNKGLFGFQMLGVLAVIERSDEIQDDFLNFLEHIFIIKKPQLHVVLDYSNTLLLKYSKKRFNEGNIHFTRNNHPKYSTLWEFGMGDSLTGNGLTLVVESTSLKKCGLECNIFCSCNYYFPIGNFIIVNSTEKNKRYVEIGFGLEAIIASLTNGDYYNNYPYSLIISSFVSKGFSKIESEELSRCYVGASILIAEGITPTSKSHGYILKKIIRKIYEILIFKEISLSKIELQLNDFIIPLSISWGDYKGLKKKLIAEIPNYVKSINYGLSKIDSQAIKRHNGNKNDIINYFHETFGIPKFLIEEKLAKIEY